MLETMTEVIESWEDDGGRAVLPPDPSVVLSGTANQVEWAERIRNRVAIEFDRVARTLRAAALKQSDRKRAQTEAILMILEDKRAGVMKRDQAGYFIQDWQEITDQVRQMIGRDPRYKDIKASRAKTNGLTISVKA